MPAAPKPTLLEYTQVLQGQLGFPAAKVYELNANGASVRVASGPFFKDLNGFLQEASKAYSARHPEFLLTHPNAEIGLQTKPYASVLEKAYRENVVFNRQYPAPPRDGWIDGQNFWVRLNDVLRCRIVCKYLDGPEFLSKQFEAKCQKLQMGFGYYPMNSASGYHSWHCHVTHQVEIIEGADVQTRDLSVELQITTQLAEVLTGLTHHLYEGTRLLPPGSRDESWRWQPESAEFRSTYMGHSLHLLEGVILSLKTDVEAREAAADDKAGEA